MKLVIQTFIDNCMVCAIKKVDRHALGDMNREISEAGIKGIGEIWKGVTMKRKSFGRGSVQGKNSKEY